MHDWWYGNEIVPHRGWVCMAVIPDKSYYGIDKDLCFSYPLTIDKMHEWSIVGDLELSKEAMEKIEASEAELLEEKRLAFEHLGLWKKTENK